MDIYPRILICLALSFLALPGCGQTIEKAVVTDTIDRIEDYSVTGNFSSQSAQVLDSAEVTRFFTEHPNLKDFEKDVRNFYQERRFAYAWFEKGLLIEQAGNLSNSLLSMR